MEWCLLLVVQVESLQEEEAVVQLHQMEFLTLVRQEAQTVEQLQVLEVLHTHQVVVDLCQVVGLLLRHQVRTVFQLEAVEEE
jgi:hypothetical protein